MGEGARPDQQATEVATVREYRCTGCGITNRAINDLTGLRHTQTGRKPSECEGHYEPAGDGGDRMLRVLVCGSRAWTDRARLRREIQAAIADCGQVVLIEGGARGADRLAGELAREHGWTLEVYPADWRRHGRLLATSCRG